MHITLSFTLRKLRLVTESEDYVGQSLDTLSVRLKPFLAYDKSLHYKLINLRHHEFF